MSLQLKNCRSKIGPQWILGEWKNLYRNRIYMKQLYIIDESILEWTQKSQRGPYSKALTELLQMQTAQGASNWSLPVRDQQSSFCLHSTFRGRLYSRQPKPGVDSNLMEPTCYLIIPGTCIRSINATKLTCVLVIISKSTCNPSSRDQDTDEN